MNEKYKEILYLEHYKSKKYKQMSSADRAAQFGSFAALTGHSDMIKEEGRFVDDKIILNDEQVFNLNDKLNYLCANMEKEPQCTVTYFVPDSNKSGGVYITEQVQLRKIDVVNRVITTTKKNNILIDDILEINI